MGNRAQYPSTSGASVGRTYCEFKIQANGAGVPIVLRGASFLATVNPVTHTPGSNVLVVTMRDQWPEIVAHSVDVRDDAGNGQYATIGSFINEGSVATGASGAAPPVGFKIQTFTASGTAQNDSTLVIVISLAIRNSSESYGN